jgi:aminopeptidase N
MVCRSPRLFGEAGGAHDETAGHLDETSQTVVFDGMGERPVLSINRGFSAPVIVESDRSAADLAFLSRHDDDPFARYEALQQLMLDTLVAAAVEVAPIRTRSWRQSGRRSRTRSWIPAFVAEAVLLPSEAFIADQLARVDPEAVFAAREGLRRTLGQRLDGQWREAYDGARQPYAYTPADKGLRRLRNVALSYIAASGSNDWSKLAFTQFEAADNMTDRQAALTTLAHGQANEREAALDVFYNRYRDNALVLDKWFQTQALSGRDDTPRVVAELVAHPDFSLGNPNRARSLIGAFGVNQRAFNTAGGEGYRLLADQLIALDRLNPQTAAKLLPPLARWKRYDEGRAALMRGELERILQTPGLSKDLFEQASKSLAG